jgi:hypothetical protein
LQPKRFGKGVVRGWVRHPRGRKRMSRQRAY